MVVSERLSTQQYIDFSLEDNILPTDYGMDFNCMLIKDSSRPHTAAITIEFEPWIIMDWPPLYSDLIPTQSEVTSGDFYWWMTHMLLRNNIFCQELNVIQAGYLLLILFLLVSLNC